MCSRSIRKDESDRRGSPCNGYPSPCALSRRTLSAVTRDGTTLLTGNADNGTVQLLDLNLPTWPQRACRIANRNLTRQEWRQYLGDLPYQLTCPGLPAGS